MKKKEEKSEMIEYSPVKPCCALCAHRGDAEKCLNHKLLHAMTYWEDAYREWLRRGRFLTACVCYEISPSVSENINAPDVWEDEDEST